MHGNVLELLRPSGSILFSLNIANNNFGGTVPSVIGDLPNLDFIDISDNFFTGELPVSALPVLNRLQYLGVQANCDLQWPFADAPDGCGASVCILTPQRPSVRCVPAPPTPPTSVASRAAVACGWGGARRRPATVCTRPRSSTFCASLHQAARRGLCKRDRVQRHRPH